MLSFHWKPNEVGRRSQSRLLRFLRNDNTVVNKSAKFAKSARN